MRIVNRTVFCALSMLVDSYELLVILFDHLDLRRPIVLSLATLGGCCHFGLTELTTEIWRAAFVY